MAQWIKNLSAMQETWDRSLGWEDPLEEGMATHSSILAWEIPSTEEPGRLQSAAAKLLQLCPTLCDPIDGSPPGSRPWDSPGKNTGVGCHCLLVNCKKKKGGTAM